jgi:preprotein translocase subunit YajC
MIDIAYAMAPPGQGAGDSSQWIQMLVTMGLIFAIFYFLMIRPQQKKAQEHKKLLDNLKKGDGVLTQGGIYGKVVGIDGQVLTVEIADKVKVKVSRASIAGLATSTESQ